LRVITTFNRLNVIGKIQSPRVIAAFNILNCFRYLLA